MNKAILVIDMPNCCDECFALDDNGDYPLCLITQEQRGYNFRTREQKMSKCPLRPAPEKIYIPDFDDTVKTEKYNDATTNLPTAKEYRETAKKSAFRSTSQWSEPKYQCPECGGGMCRNEMVVLTSNPVQYEYQCDKCGHVDYQYI